MSLRRVRGSPRGSSQVRLGRDGIYGCCDDEGVEKAGNRCVPRGGWRDLRSSCDIRGGHRFEYVTTAVIDHSDVDNAFEPLLMAFMLRKTKIQSKKRFRKANTIVWR